MVKKIYIPKIATLILIPLFGIHSIISILPSVQSKDVYQIVMTILAVLDSTSGTIVACVYCFSNHEVKDELRRSWENWRYYHR